MFAQGQNQIPELPWWGVAVEVASVLGLVWVLYSQRRKRNRQFQKPSQPVAEMNNYQKIAVLVVRIFAGLLIAIGFLWLVIEFLNMAMLQSMSAGALQRLGFQQLVNDAAIITFGLFLWLFANPLGRLLGKGLD